MAIMCTLWWHLFVLNSLIGSQLCLVLHAIAFPPEALFLGETESAFR